MSLTFDSLSRQLGLNFEKGVIVEDELDSALNTLDKICKGGKKAAIGEKRTFGGREYIKTAQGWKFHGKGTGVKAKQHGAHAAEHDAKQYPGELPKKTVAGLKDSLKSDPVNSETGSSADFNKRVLLGFEDRLVASEAGIKWKEFSKMHEGTKKELRKNYIQNKDEEDNKDDAYYSKINASLQKNPQATYRSYPEEDIKEAENRQRRKQSFDEYWHPRNFDS